MGTAASRHTVGVAGAGFMGAGIAQVAAQAGYDVALVDVDENALARARAAIADSAARLHAKGRSAENAEAVLARIRMGTDIAAFAGADLVIESVFERVEDKHALLPRIEAVVGAHAILATNTSTIPITLLAECLRRKERFVGIHFFSPVPVNPMLEIISSEHTSGEAVRAAEAFSARIGKAVLHVKKDVPGFILNRLYGAMTCEAIRLVEEGVATVDDIDRGMEVAYGHANGPLKIADLVGLDVCLLVFNNMHTIGGWPAPPEMLTRLVREGKLGRKSGEGFYRYDRGPKSK